VLTVAVDSIMARDVVMDLCEAFLALNSPTRLRIRHEALSGTMAALTSGQADLALGVALGQHMAADIQHVALGDVPFVFAVAPQHPLAQAAEPLSNALLLQHRVVAVADSVQRGSGLTVGLQGGQDVFTVPDMPSKLQAQLRGLGAGFLPHSLAQPFVAKGQLVIKTTEQTRLNTVHAAWRDSRLSPAGHALLWWTAQLNQAATKEALLGLKV
jgi:DNA-binding transcriptional LysR family regulator